MALFVIGVLKAQEAHHGGGLGEAAQAPQSYEILDVLRGLISSFN